MKQRRAPALAVLSALLTACASAPPARPAAPPSEPPVHTCPCRLAKVRAATGPHWVGTWASAPQPIESASGLAHATLRQVLRVSVGGERLRVRFSNQYGNGPLTITAAHLAMAQAQAGVDAATDRELRFSGQPGVTIAAGETVWSDPLDFHLPPLGRLAVSVATGEVPETLTGHATSASELQPGNAVGAADLKTAVGLDAGYLLSGVDVWAAPTSQAIVVLGDSLSDGWPAALAERLHTQPATANIAVLDQSLDGNALVLHGKGPTAARRFARDVLEQSGARWLIILAGLHDIAAAQGDASASIIAAYQDLIARAHARDMLVYGVPILPFGGSTYDTPAHQTARRRVNAWLREHATVDAVIDLPAAVHAPADPTRLAPDLDSGDHVHPNPAGQRKMADAVPLSLFQR